MDKIEKESHLNLLLEFVNLDLNALPFSEKAAWATRFFFAYTGLFLDQEAMRDPTHKKEFEGLPKIHKVLRAHIQKIMNAKAGDWFFMPPLEREFIVGDSFNIRYSTPDDRIIDVKKSPDTSIVIAELNELLDGLPRNALKTCPECGRVYAYLSKRGKEYCSPKCTYRFLSRKRRNELKKHPRKYKSFLKKQRETMHKVYARRRKQESGPNVKVRRNGRKGD